MAITSQKTNVSQKEPIAFPKLMISSKGNVVLFNNKKHGVLVYVANSGFSIGHYSEGWIPADFKDYEGDVILTNK